MYYRDENTRFLSIFYYLHMISYYNIKEKNFNLVANACIYLADVISENYPIRISDIVEEKNIPKTLKWCRNIFKNLNYNLYVRTPCLFLSFIKEHFYMKNEDKIIKLTSSLILDSILDKNFYSFTGISLSFSSFYIIRPFNIFEEKIAEKYNYKVNKECAKMLVKNKINKLK